MADIITSVMTTNYGWPQETFDVFCCVVYAREAFKVCCAWSTRLKESGLSNDQLAAILHNEYSVLWIVKMYSSEIQDYSVNEVQQPALNISFYKNKS